jgi:hypothetical protein
MATVTQPPILDARQGKGPQVVNPPITQKSQPVPIKVAWYGPQGSGKTGSAALLALALSVEVYNRAPVAVVDTEPGWQFYKGIFAIEGVELIQSTTPTFKAMIRDLRDSERRGCGVWAIDSLTVIWQEFMKAAQGNRRQIEIQQWGAIKQQWGEYTTAFLNSPMSTMALGRLGNEMEERLTVDEQTKVETSKLVKTGTKFKAGGSETFGYEPHLLLEMSLEKKPKVMRKSGDRIEGEGRMIHRVDVLKDRTWALNGAVIRWPDRPGYKKGDYKYVWNSLKPHFDQVQKTMAMVTLNTDLAERSDDLFDQEGNSEFYRTRKRRETLADELEATINLLWGGQGAAEKRMRLLVADNVFGVKTRTAWEQLEIDKVERGVRIMQAFERRTKAEGMPTTESGILNALQLDIDGFDQGTAEQEEMPF